jgi:hypothetical protein
MRTLEFLTIRLLRRLPISTSFDAHLTRCAFASTLLDENLTLGKLLGWTALESGVSELDASNEAVEAAMFAGWIAENRDGGVVGEVVGVENVGQTIH